MRSTRAALCVLPEPPYAFVADRIASSELTPIPIEHAHALRVAVLPFHHRDPFDRLLIAPAAELQVPVITDDQSFGAYEIGVISAVPGPAGEEGEENDVTPAVVEPGAIPAVS